MFARLMRLAVCLLTVAGAADRVTAAGPGPTHEERWNQFVERLYALHQRQVEGRDIVESSRLGGYHRMPEFYREVSYVDKRTQRLLSRIQWEREHPENLHAIEVYLYDASGRVARDYVALFYPGRRTVPMQTYINLHNYTNGLHAFRQFDASNNRIYENCQGTHDGEPVALSVYEEEIIRTESGAKGVTDTPVYRACFAGLPLTAEAYLRPR